LFVEASDFAGFFRLVLVPRREDFPQGTSIFREPGQLPAVQERPAYVSASLDFPEFAPDLRRFFDLSQLDGNDNEAGSVLDRLLARDAPLFRAAFEQEHVREELLMSLLASKENRLCDFWQGGAPLAYARLSPALWINPEENLPVVLRSAERLRSSELRREVLRGLAGYLLEHPGRAALFDLLSRNQQDDCVQHACRLTNSEVERLLDILGDRPAARVFFDELAGRLLRGPRRDAELENWLLCRDDLPERRFARAVLALYHWLDQDLRTDFSLQEYILDRTQYNALLDRAWSWCEPKLTPRGLVNAFHNPGHAAEFIRRVADAFPAWRYKHQCEMLSEIAPLPLDEDERTRMAYAIRQSPDRRDLAPYYRKLLQHYGAGPDGAMSLLSRIENEKTGWGPFKW
jgi:hypothetical protein